MLDVRPREEYCAGHIPGTISIPLEELEGHIGELPRGREVVAYCRGPYCVLAIEAVERLRGEGLEATLMEYGVVEWRAYGFAVEEE